jgi:putative membrane protein
VTSQNRSLALFAGIALLYGIGVVGHALPAVLPSMLTLTPWFLVLSGTVVFVAFASRAPAGPLLWWFVPVGVVTFGLEVVGVATGWIFGPYHYLTTLGTLWWGVPPVIGLNWVLVVLGAHSGSRLLLPRSPAWVRIVSVGLACVGFDLLLEPVAIALGYWVWHTASVPWQNYLAWGLIAAAGAGWAERFPGLPTKPILGWYALLQACFFLVLGLLAIHR